MSRERLILRAEAKLLLDERRARRDFAAFCSYCFDWQLAPFHLRWFNAVQQHDRTVIAAAIEHAKTSVLAVALPLWTLGQNPNARIAIVSETASQAQRPLAAIREHIQRNQRLRALFGLRPAKGAREKWTDSEIVIERPAASKDPSIIACGVLGPLLGSRLDLAIGDDLCSWENSFTAGQREKVKAWFRSTLVGRMVVGSRIVVIGTPWSDDDLLSELQRNPEYHSITDPAIGETGEPLWPEQWTIDRLDQRKREIGLLEFERQMMLRVLSDAASRFKMEWFEHSFRTAAEVDATLVDHYGGEELTFSGVDLGVGTGKQHDESVIFTIALQKDGRRRVLSIESGKWQAPELIERLRSVWQRYRSRLRVESNAAQRYVVDFLRNEGVPVQAHTTTAKNKRDPKLGVESLAVEFEQGRWVVPDAPSTRVWVRELLAYSPGAHAGDRVMASWLARESAREYEAATPLPMPFITSSTPSPFLMGQPSTAALTCSPGDLPDDSWGVVGLPPFLRG